MKLTTKLLPGLIFTAAFALLSQSVSQLSFVPISSLTLGILLSIIYSNTTGINKTLQPGVTFSLKTLLKVGIILLGVDLNFVALYQTGPKILLLAVIVVIFALVLSHLLTKPFRISQSLAALLAVGSSICGASAVVAVAPIVDADEDETALAAAIISLLGAFGVLLYPIVGSLAKLTSLQYGYWSGASLQGVAHALAAAFIRGEVSLEAATYIKMTRVVMLAPVAIFLSILFNKTKSATTTKVKFPLYVLGFILVGVLASTGILSAPIGSISIAAVLKLISKFFILMAMIGMGLNVNLSKIKQVGLKATMVTTIIFVSLSTVTVVYVKLFM